MFVPTPGGFAFQTFPKAIADFDQAEWSPDDGRTPLERFHRFLQTPAASRWGLPVGVAHRSLVRIPVPIRVINCLDRARSGNDDELPDTMSFPQLMSLPAFGVNSLLALTNAMEEFGFPPVAVTPLVRPDLEDTLDQLEPDRFPREGQRVLPGALLPFVPESGLLADMLPPDALDAGFWSGPHRNHVQQARECARRYLDDMLKARIRGVLDLAVPIEKIREGDSGVRWSSRTLRLLRNFLEHGPSGPVLRVRDVLGFPGATTASILDVIAGAEEAAILMHDGDYEYPNRIPEPGTASPDPEADAGSLLDPESIERLLATLGELRAVGVRDVRFGPILRTFPGAAATFGQIFDDPQSFRRRAPIRFDRALERTAAMLERVKGLSLDEEMVELFDGAELGPGHSHVARLRFRAGERVSMADIAEERDVTRARIHQIVDQIEERIRPSHAPVRDALRSRAPVIADAVAGLPITDGPAVGYFPDRLRPVLSRLADCETRLVECMGVTMVVRVEHAAEVEGLLAATQRRIRKWSGGRRDTLVAEAGPDGAGAVIERLLARSPEPEWIDREEGVFVVDPTQSRNTIVTPISKVVAVAGRITPHGLRAAVLRNYRFSGLPYASRHLVELCQRIPGIEVAGEMIRNVSLDEVGLMGPEEIHLWRLLRPAGTVLSRTQIRDALRAQITSSATLTAALTYSIIIQRVTPGHYTLVGTELSQEVLDGLRLARPTRGSFLVSKGRVPDGRAWICYRASPSLLESAVFSVPGMFRTEMCRTLELRSVEGGAAYPGNSNGEHAWFGQRFLRGERIEPGDGILMVFDFSTGHGVFVLGDPEELADRAEDGDWESLLAVRRGEPDEDPD